MSPDGSTKPPPEEKLLHLIRAKGPWASESNASAAAAAAPARRGTGAGSDWRGRAIGGLRWPKLAAIGFGILLVFEVGLLVVQAMRPLPSVRVPEVEPLSNSAVSVTIPQPESAPSLAASVSRPLFVPPIETQAPVTTTPPKTGPSATAKLLAARLTLMGIMAGNPAQAIIEDSQTRKSYFVSPGQPVVEGAVLDQVFDNRVLLDFEGEKIELTL